MSGRVVIEDSGTGLADQQDRDWLDAANVLAVAHGQNNVNYQVSGFGLTPDYGAPDVDVASGMAKLQVNGVDTRSHGEGTITWPVVTVTVFVEAETLSLTDNDVNEIYIDVGLSSGPDDVQLVAVDSGGSAPTAPALKIAEVDTSADTATLVNEHPDATFGDVTADSLSTDSLNNADILNAADNQILVTDGNGNLTVETQAEGPNPYDQAQTFLESDVTVTNNDTAVSNGSIILSGLNIIDDFEDGDIVTKSTDWDGWNGDTGDLTAQQNTVISGQYSGKFEVAGTVSRINTDRGSNITSNLRLTIQIGSDTSNSDDLVQIQLHTTGFGSDIGNLTFNGNGGNVDWEGTEVLSSWSAGTEYTLFFDWDFDNDQFDLDVNGTNEGTFNFRNSASGFGNIRPINDTLNSGETRAIYLDDIEVEFSPTSGDALIEWDKGVPTDIFEWDVATYTATEDGETVTVDVEDGQGNVLLSDISRNTDISSIATSENVTLRVNLSRSDTSNNPTLDSAYRSWLV
jgi:hypothetical protein